MKITIPNHVKNIMYKLEEKGYKAYLSGGCVRDYFLGNKPSDFDICTNCQIEKIGDALNCYQIIQKGAKYGAAAVKTKEGLVDIVTFRRDGNYLDFRRPEKVAYTDDVKEDLKRRDFTINAICVDLEGTVIDPFNGRNDLDAKVIRCVGDPLKRFQEDPLRIMRALRFSSVLGFEIEENTKNALFKQKNLLKKISSERIYLELSKIMCGDNIVKILLEFKDIFATIIPEIELTFGCTQNCPYHIYDVYGHLCYSVGNIEPDFELRFCMFLHDIEKPSMKTTDEQGDHFKNHQIKSAKTAEKILKNLKSSNKTRKRIVNLILEHDNRISACEADVKRFLGKYGYDFYFDWLKVRRADIMAKSDYKKDENLENLENLERIAVEIMQKNECINLSGLAVNGNDMRNIGLSGRDVGKALQIGLNSVIEGKIKNDKNEIIGIIRSNFNEQ